MNHLPLIQATEATFSEYCRVELIFLREYWRARWNDMRGVHAIQ